MGAVRVPFGMMGDRRVEEAVVAAFTAIGNLRQETATDPIFGALPERAMNSVATALGANVTLMTVRGFVHGKLLSDKVGVFNDRGKIYYNYQWPESNRNVEWIEYKRKRKAPGLSPASTTASGRNGSGSLGASRGRGGGRGRGGRCGSRGRGVWGRVGRIG